MQKNFTVKTIVEFFETGVATNVRLFYPVYDDEVKEIIAENRHPDESRDLVVPFLGRRGLMVRDGMTKGKKEKKDEKGFIGFGVYFVNNARVCDG